MAELAGWEARHILVEGAHRTELGVEGRNFHRAEVQEIPHIRLAGAAAAYLGRFLYRLSACHTEGRAVHVHMSCGTEIQP